MNIDKVCRPYTISQLRLDLHSHQWHTHANGPFTSMCKQKSYILCTQTVHKHSKWNQFSINHEHCHSLSCSPKIHASVNRSHFVLLSRPPQLLNGRANILYKFDHKNSFLTLIFRLKVKVIINYNFQGHLSFIQFNRAMTRSLIPKIACTFLSKPLKSYVIVLFCTHYIIYLFVCAFGVRV